MNQCSNSTNHWQVFRASRRVPAPAGAGPERFVLASINMGNWEKRVMHINSRIPGEERDWSKRTEQSSEPLLHSLEGYSAKYSILGTYFHKQSTNRTEDTQWHFPVYPVWDCKCSLSYSYTDNSTANILQSGGIILLVLYFKLCS